MKKEYIFCFLFFAVGTAYADPIADRLATLEKTLQAMQSDSVARNASVASALATVEQLKLDFQNIQGTVDANSHLIMGQEAEIQRLKRDVADRIASIEERLDIYDIQITKAVAKVLPKAAIETESYQKALDLVHKSDFLTAVSSFKEFLKTYPKSELADNAQYWIGECYYAMKDYAKAIKEFQAVAEKYISSDKIAGALLKQAFSFVELNMLEEAKPFLNKVMKNFSGSDEAVRAKEKLDKIEQKLTPPSAPAGTPAGTNVIPSIPSSTSNIPLAPGVKQP